MFPRSTENSQALERQIWAFVFLRWADFQVAANTSALLTRMQFCKASAMYCSYWIYVSMNYFSLLYKKLNNITV